MTSPTSKILWALGSAAVSSAAALSVLTDVQAALVGVVVLLVVLWTNEGLPLGVVSLLPIVLFPAFHILPTKATTVNYAHPIIYLFLGGFMLAIAVEKSGLHLWIAGKMLGIFPASGRGIILSLAVTSGLMSSILSNTTTALLLMTIALFLSEDPRLKMRFTLAIAYGASVGGILTPIGTPPNLILLGIMEDRGMMMIPFIQWMWMVAPLAIVMVVVISAVLSIGLKAVRLERPREHKALTADQKKILAVLGGLVALLLVNAPIRPWWEGLGMSEPVLLLSAGLLLFTPPFRLLVWQEDKAKIPYRIMFLFGAGFAIAKAFSETGLANVIAEYLVSYSHLAPLYLMVIIAVMITFTTEITSNTALISIMLPVIYAVTQQTGLDSTLFMMVATICASYAFMLPIATPPNAIAMSSGVIPIRTMALYGLLFNLIGITLIVLIAALFWQPVLGE
jgi:sodium-dependent dicarboxylate transporter 2/3/5